MEQLHKRLSKEHAWYADWHKMKYISAIHFVILIGVASFMASSLTEIIDAQPSVQYTAAANNASSDSIGSLTKQLFALSKEYNLAADTDAQAAIAQELTQVVIARKALLLSQAGNNPHNFLLNALPPGIAKQLPESIQALLESEVDTEGTLTVIHVDHYEQNKSELEYHVKDATSQKTYHLHFAEGETKLTTGAKVKAHGTALDQELVVAYAGGQALQTLSAATTAGSTGVQKSIVMLINFTDNASQPYSQAQVSGIMFTNPDSLNAYYQENSFGQTSFAGDVTPWFTVPLASATVCSNYYTVMSAADSAAAAAGFVLGNYARKIYVFPNSNCGFGGVSTIGGNPSWSFGMAYGQPHFVQVFEHELGHALGQFHASTISCGAKAIDAYVNCTKSEYGENYDSLGYYNSNHSNQAHKSFFGWLTATNIQPVNANGTYTIAPIESRTSATQVLKITKPDTSEYYYIGYRQPIGFDASVPSGIASGAIIHIAANSNTYFIDATPGDSTFANAALVDGSSFTDPMNGITVTQVGHIPGISATVRVQFAAPTCFPAKPTLTISPSSQGGSARSSLTYTATLKNNDSSSCPASTFALSDISPAGWSGTLSPVSLMAPPGGSATATYTVTPALTAPDGTYVVTIQSNDSQNSIHSASASANYVTFTDSAPPTVSVASPVNGTKLKGNANTNISVSASDAGGIYSIEIVVDGTSAKTCLNITSCAYSWNGKSITAGTHVITAHAVDKSNNKGSVSTTITK